MCDNACFDYRTKLEWVEPTNGFGAIIHLAMLVTVTNAESSCKAVGQILFLGLFCPKCCFVHDDQHSNDRRKWVNNSRAVACR